MLGPSDVVTVLTGRRKMTLNATESDAFTWTPAHEFGHVLGLQDRCSESIMSKIRRFAPTWGSERRCASSWSRCRDPRTGRFCIGRASALGLRGGGRLGRAVALSGRRSSCPQRSCCSSGSGRRAVGGRRRRPSLPARPDNPGAAVELRGRRGDPRLRHGDRSPDARPLRARPCVNRRQSARNHATSSLRPDAHVPFARRRAPFPQMQTTGARRASPGRLCVRSVMDRSFVRRYPRSEA
jgi:hypothetical protein